jgi:pilus assembly protein CpaE
MMTLIVSDNQMTATQLRNGLIQHGHHCPVTNVVSMDMAGEALRAMPHPPDLILLVVGSGEERSDEALRALRACRSARLVAIGSRDPGRILRAFREGADDYLDERGNLMEDLSVSLQRVSELTKQTEVSGVVVSVVAGSGGSGRTTIATNLAVLAAGQHKRCGLLDLDLHGGNAAAYLDLTPRHSVADLCRNLTKLDQNMFEQSLAVHESGVHLLPAPDSTDELGDVSVEGITRILRIARSLFPVVFVDLDECNHDGARHVLRQSSLVLLVSRLDIPALENTRRTLDSLERSGVDRTKIRFVVSRCGQPNELPPARVEQVLGLTVFESVPDDPKSVNLSINCGRACVSESPRSRFSLAMSSLAKRILEVQPAQNGVNEPRFLSTPPKGEAGRIPGLQWIWSRLNPSTG